MGIRFRRLAGASSIGLVMAVGVVAPMPADAAKKPVTTGVVFNNPNDKSSDSTIVKQLATLIGGTEKGDRIRLVAFRLQDERVVKPLIAAAREGVDVQVIVDADAKGKAGKQYEKLATALNKDSNRRTYAIECPKGNGCIADTPNKAIMHSKFATFSRTGGASDVVFIPTANWNFKEGGTGGWNSAYTEVGNNGLYRRHSQYFDMLAAGDRAKKDGGGSNIYDLLQPLETGKSKTYFHPRAQQTKNNDDTYVNILDEVSCDGGTTIRISNWYFGRSAVAEKLRSLSLDGCDVQIVANQIGPKTCAALTADVPDKLKWMSKKKPKIKVFSVGERDHGTHEKNMLIDGDYRNKRTKVTWTGSHNLTNASLNENDENTIRITNAGIHDEFVSNFDRIYRAADVKVDAAGDCRKAAPVPQANSARGGAGSAAPAD